MSWLKLHAKSLTTWALANQCLGVGPQYNYRPRVPGAYHVNSTGSSTNHSTTSNGTIGSSTISSSTGNGNRQRFYGRPQGGFASSGGQPRPQFPPLCKTAMRFQCGAGHVENLVICLVCIRTTNKTNQSYKNKHRSNLLL